MQKFIYILRRVLLSFSDSWFRRISYAKGNNFVITHELEQNLKLDMF